MYFVTPTTSLTSIFKCIAHGIPHRSTNSVVDKLAHSITIGTISFHPKGMLPFNNLRSHVLSPSVFLSTKLVKFSLILAELCDVCWIIQSFPTCTPPFLESFSTSIKNLFIKARDEWGGNPAWQATVDPNPIGIKITCFHCVL